MSTVSTRLKCPFEELRPPLVYDLKAHSRGTPGKSLVNPYCDRSIRQGHPVTDRA